MLRCNQKLLLLTGEIPKLQFLFQPQLHLLATAQKPAVEKQTCKQKMSLLPFAHNEYSVHLRFATAQSLPSWSLLKQNTRYRHCRVHAAHRVTAQLQLLKFTSSKISFVLPCVESHRELPSCVHAGRQAFQRRYISSPRLLNSRVVSTHRCYITGRLLGRNRSRKLTSQTAAELETLSWSGHNCFRKHGPLANRIC